MRVKRDWRVTWKRDGTKIKHKIYTNKASAKRFMVLLGPEPWKAVDFESVLDNFMCCNGRECRCGGITYRDYYEKAREGLPPIIEMYLESRFVDTWERET